MFNTVLFLGYDDMQAIDLIGPWEVFIILRDILYPDLKLHIVSETGAPFSIGNGLTLPAHMSFAQAPKADLLFVPGGTGRVKQTENKTLLDFIQTQYKTCEHIASICTGTFLLYAAGLLQEKKCTTYWRALLELYRLSDVSDITVSEERIVRDGNVWTTGGLVSGIDLALAMISELCSSEIAGRVQLVFEYFPPTRAYTRDRDIYRIPPYSPDDYGARRVPRYIKKTLWS